MRKELTIAELDSEKVELLPARETLGSYGTGNWASIYASNSSLAFNAAAANSSASSVATQTITVAQG